MPKTLLFLWYSGTRFLTVAIYGMWDIRRFYYFDFNFKICCILSWLNLEQSSKESCLAVCMSCACCLPLARSSSLVVAFLNHTVLEPPGNGRESSDTKKKLPVQTQMPPHPLSSFITAQH